MSMAAIRASVPSPPWRCLISTGSRCYAARRVRCKPQRNRGAVNIYTKQPSLDGYDGFIMAGVGNFGRYETQGAVNLPIVDDKLAVRAAWTFTNVDGYIDNVLPDTPYGSRLAGVYDFGGRLSALLKPTDDFTAILRLGYFWSNPVNYGVFAKDIPEGEGIGITPGSLAFAGIPQSATRRPAIRARGRASSNPRPRTCIAGASPTARSISR